METLERNYAEDTSVRFPIQFFIHGHPYKLWGLVENDLHLFGVESPGLYFPFGTDEFGRDLYSRTMHGSRITLSIGFIGVIFSFVVGCVMGGASGYFGGTIDLVIQRIINHLGVTQLSNN